MRTNPIRKLLVEGVAIEKQAGHGVRHDSNAQASPLRIDECSRNRPFNVLLCGSDGANGLRAELRHILERASQSGLLLIEAVEQAGLNPEQLATRVRGTVPDLVFLILEAGQLTQFAPLFQALRAGFVGSPVIAVTDGMEESDLYSLLRLGATDFLVAPLRSSEVLSRVRRLLDWTWRSDASVHALKETLGLKQIIGESPALLQEIQKIPQMACCDATLLISGETGTGKEVFARSVHYLSRRAGRPFIAVNCGAIPLELVENELFGHEPGAFTNAATAQTGLVQEADGGTLFLDEIDTLPPLAQVKLLRLLQEKEYRPLGAHKPRRADVRVIAASNIILEQAMRGGRFRQDLYYRLNVLPMTLPPLRERQEDIPLLARHFVRKYSAEFQREAREIAPGAMQKLFVYPWPGNVRELENVVQRAILICETAAIQARDFALPGCETEPFDESFRALKARAVAQFERSYLQAVLLEHDGNINSASRAAQKNRRAFWELLRKHQMLPQQA